MKEVIATYSERVMLALLVLVIFIAAGWILSLLVQRLSQRRPLGHSRMYRMIAGSVNSIVVGAGAVTALGTLGVNITALVAGLGLTGFAVGLALKDAIGNLVAGLMLVIYAPFNLEDIIDLGGIKGEVVDMNLRYVTLRTDTDTVLIPNGNFITSVIRKSSNAPAAVAAQTRTAES